MSGLEGESGGWRSEDEEGRATRVQFVFHPRHLWYWDK